MTQISVEGPTDTSASCHLLLYTGLPMLDCLGFYSLAVWATSLSYSSVFLAGDKVHSQRSCLTGVSGVQRARQERWYVTC